jgi:uncharacterized membrane protein YfcA
MESISLWWLAYPALGTLAGFLGGLFGTGGGLVIVPILYMIFAAQHFPHEHLMHLALGTSIASIVFTSIASTYAHHGLGNVDWRVFRAMGPGLVIGSVGGSFLASQVPTTPLVLIFIAIVLYASGQLIIDFKPPATRQLPGKLAQFVVGFSIGVAAALTAASGGFLAIPYLVWHNVAMKRAIGTSAAIGLPVAIAGATGYLVSGVGATGVPPLSIGYVNLPALIGVALCTMLFVQFGARLASRMNIVKLKRVYGAYLLIIALKMLHSSLN